MSNLKYINVSKKRLVGRSNQTVPPLCIDYSTLFDISFQFIDERNQIIPLDSSLSGFAFAGSLKMGDMSSNLLWLCQDFSIENDTLTFHNVNTFTVPFVNQIKKKNTEVNIEISQMSLNTKQVWLRDFALCEPRVWVAGLSPTEVDSQAYYTKVEINELLDIAKAEDKAYADTVAASTLSSAQDYADDVGIETFQDAKAYTNEAISHIEISGYVTEEEFNEAIDTIDNDISGVSDAIQGVKSTVDGHVADNTIHVTAADKTAWNGKLDPSALNGYATEQYVNGQVSGKADQSVLTAHTSDTEIHTTALEKAAWDAKQNAITNDSKLAYSLLSGTPDLSVYAKPNCLRLTAKAANSTVGLMLAGNATAKNVEWSSDEGATWTAFTWTNGYTNVVALANAGDSIILRCNDGQFSTGDSDWVQFVLTGSIAASGNVMSLLSNDALLDEVPAYAFLNLFRDQTALVEAPELPAMKLNYRSYFCMFYGCSLAHAPKLPAEQYAYQCYGSMFGGGHHAFTSIEIAGQWDPLGNDTSAMEKMFKGCSALNSVTVHWTNWPSNGGTTNWLQNVSAAGKFYCPYSLNTSNRGSSGIPNGWEIEYLDVPEEVLAGKQDKITSSNKLDFALLSGVPEDNPALVPIEVKTATGDCIYEVDFTGKAIQKYDLASATGGSNSLEILFTNLANFPNGVAPTIELQIPVTEADVSTISLPAGTQVIDMPDSLTSTSGKISYADIVFRAEKDVNDTIKVYCNYSYNFDEEEEV